MRDLDTGIKSRPKWTLCLDDAFIRGNCVGTCSIDTFSLPRRVLKVMVGQTPEIFVQMDWHLDSEPPGTNVSKI